MSTIPNAAVRVPSERAVPQSGPLVIWGERLEIETARRVELVDITEGVRERIRQSGVREGAASLWSLHTTCALFINEAQIALHADILRVLEDVVARDAAWLHNDPEHSDCDRMNADAHLRAMLLGHSLTMQVQDGEPVLGTWQRVLVGEMDGPRQRTIRLQVMGIA